MDWEGIQTTLNSLHTHNNPPSATQALHLRTARRQYQADSALLDAEISSLEATIAQLTQILHGLHTRRDECRERAQTCLAALSPIRSLPAELLGEIFVRCLPRKAHPSPAHAPLLLCRVCAHWRRVALAVPQLWCTFSITHEAPGVYNSDIVLRNQPLLRNAIRTGSEWFRRAGAGMLALSVRSGVAHEDALRHIVDALVLPHVAQFRSLELVSSRLFPFAPLLALPPGRAQQLESLVLGFEGGVPVTVFEAAPRLRRACVSGLYGNDRLFPWAQLTHLKIAQYLSAPRWVAVLAQCVRLERGEFGVRGASARDLRGAHEHVVLPHLHDLAVKVIGGDASLLERFALPALRSFKLDAELILGRAGWLEPSAFYAQLGALRRLSLINKAITAQDLIQLLRCTTALVELELDNSLDYGSLLRSLIYIDRSANLIPRLEAFTVYLGVGPLSAFPCHVFVNMVNSRQWAGVEPPPRAARLRRVAVYALNEWRAVLQEVDAWLAPHRVYNGQLVAELKVVPLLPQADDRVDLVHW